MFCTMRMLFERTYMSGKLAVSSRARTWTMGWLAWLPDPNDAETPTLPRRSHNITCSVRNPSSTKPVQEHCRLGQYSHQGRQLELHGLWREVKTVRNHRILRAGMEQPQRQL